MLSTGPGDTRERHTRSLSHYKLTTLSPHRLSTGQSPSSPHSAQHPASPGLCTPLQPRPPGPSPHPKLQTHDRLPLPVLISGPLHVLHLLPAMPFPLLVLYDSIYLSPLPGSTLRFQAELATPASGPRPHYILSAWPWTSEGARLSLPGRAGGGSGEGLTHLCAPPPSTAPGTQWHVAEEQMTVNTWPQPGFIKHARTALECHRPLLSAPLPLRPDAGFAKDRHRLPHSV